MVSRQSRGGESPRSQSQPLPAYAFSLGSLFQIRATLHWSTALDFVFKVEDLVSVIHLQFFLFIGGNKDARGHNSIAPTVL
jgi:hypothetical protein